jgi:hypothetical protein
MIAPKLANPYFWGLREGFVMDAANWTQSKQRGRGALLEAAIQRAMQGELREHAIRLLKGISLIMIVAIAIDLLVFATLALVGLECPLRGISHGWA